MSQIDSERRSQLLSLKLRALIRAHLGIDSEPSGEARPFALGAAFVAPDATWVLVDGDAQRSLGPVLAWASDNDRPIHLLVERDSGLVARRAGYFSRDITVWHVDDRALFPAVAEPHLGESVADPRHVELSALIATSGADPVIEHGIVVGEVRGLEMCRVVDDEYSGEVRLDVGMGVHDREAFAMVHGDLPTEVALRQVIDAVLPHRSEGADPHPFNQFGAERLLRWKVIQDPSLVGFVSLSPVDPPVRRLNIKDATPCVAFGLDNSGNQATVVCVHGVDLDIVPFAVDAAMRIASTRVVIVSRAKDIVGPIRKMAAFADIAVEFASVDK